MSMLIQNQLYEQNLYFEINIFRESRGIVHIFHFVTQL